MAKLKISEVFDRSQFQSSWNRLYGNNCHPITESARTMSDFWRGRKTLVTGATGFVGSWLVKALLAQGASVVGLVWSAHPGNELYRSGDIRRVGVVQAALEDFPCLERTIGAHGVDTIFHLGGQAIVAAAQRSPLPTFEANIRGTYNLLEACRLHMNSVQRVIIASSDKAYGEQPCLPCPEEAPLLGRDPYAVSKSCADLLAQAYYHTYGLPVAVSRCGNVYGGGDLNWSRVVPGTIRACLRGEPPVVWGDGSDTRDYIYVKDIVRAYLCLAERMDEDGVCGQAFNFGTEKPMQGLEMITLIQRLMDCAHIAPEFRARDKAEIRNQSISARKPRILLNWRPAFDLETSLRETIAWYRDFSAPGAGSWCSPLGGEPGRGVLGRRD